jgi:general secretion pathway protein G
MLINRIRAWARKPLIGKGRGYRQKGMSIIEILIVIALMGTIMTLVVTNVLDVGETARRDTAVLAMQQMQSSLDTYRIHNFKYPTTEQGLMALVERPPGAKRWRGPYVDEKKLDDPWGNRFVYESDGRNFKMISPGPDGTVGTEDDVVYPEDAGGEGETL